MSEINGPKFGVNQVNFNGIQKNVNEEPTEITEEKAQITDFSNSKAEALGRSMLLKEDDSVNNDLKALLDNPQIAENSDEIFETAYAAAQANGTENPYEEAATISTVKM
ncbi:MAG: hypothetical protein MJ231_00845 [bacterium]|nr:hypothetical protein [bacterium]